MEYVIVAVAAAVASGLTMYSGFGLGTILLPVFALFVPVEWAVAATAVVHAANNVLKVSLLGKLADRDVVIRFGAPAVLAAFLGAWLLAVVAEIPGSVSWQLAGVQGEITAINAVIGVLMLGFAVFELSPRFAGVELDARWLPVGGVLSGFFGGLSGHQGALRSAFLASTRITAKAFVGTNAVIGLAVDLIRIGVYGVLVFGADVSVLLGGASGNLVLVGTLAAFAGVLVGRRYLNKVTMDGVRRLTGGMLLVIAVLLIAGVV
ncbi:MAG: TSUP family transporter [Rhodothermales bacterium]|nr:TSUP family transporter [Rhodothermales bacterium]MBO6780526.1 TSUP family transporter [Rhodothermales bacterium]